MHWSKRILIWEELHRFLQEGILVEVEHVIAHRTRKEMQHMSLFERFTADGNEKADELAREGAMLDGGDMAQVRAITIQQEREYFCAALQCAASFHCLVEEWKGCGELKPKPIEKWTFVNKKGEAKKHRTEWCAAAKQRSLSEMWKKQKQIRRHKGNVKDQSSCEKIPNTSWED